MTAKAKLRRTFARTFRVALPTSSHLQQHDRHHLGRIGNVVAWSSAGVRGLKGSRKSTPFAAQLAAEDAAKKAIEHGMRTVSVLVNGPGAGRESALRALQWPLVSISDPRHHADSAQRLPPAEAAPRLSRLLTQHRPNEPGQPRRPSEQESKGSHGSIYRTCLPALPPGRYEAVSQRRSLLHRQVWLRAPCVSAGTDRTAAARTPTYGEQLREKQKVKRMCGYRRGQFRGYYYRANRMKGVTGENLLLLERRLDNIVYRLGFASNHAEARQLVRHGHFSINGARVNIPSYLVRPTTPVSVRESSKKMPRLAENLGAVDRRGVPQWLELNRTTSAAASKRCQPANPEDGNPRAAHRRAVLEVSDRPPLHRGG